MLTTSQIAVIANREGLDSQALLSETAAAWRNTGIKVAGVIAENNTETGQCSAGFVRDLVSGQEFSIQLDTLPPGSDCHLDAKGLESAATGLLAQIAQADVVILSKFGKLEAAQGGLWPVFQAAISAGKPLLTTVSPKHRDAWHAVAPKAAWVEESQAAITQWLNAAMARH